MMAGRPPAGNEIWVALLAGGGCWGEDVWAVR
jgi:hypothetical protein